MFWKLISRFEIDFRRRGNYFFLNDSNFGVFKVQSHATRLYMCNVVVSLTIHDDIHIYTKIQRDVAKT